MLSMRYRRSQRRHASLALNERTVGALVTFVDVTSVVQAEVVLREADLRKDVFLVIAAPT